MNTVKHLSDSTLMHMNKKVLIEYIRILEHNQDACEECINRQAVLLNTLLTEAEKNANS